MIKCFVCKQQIKGRQCIAHREWFATTGTKHDEYDKILCDNCYSLFKAR